MVRAKLNVYYTFKVVSTEPLEVHALKWEEFGDVPLSVYKIKPDDVGPIGGCDCPAWTRECKHIKCVKEARNRGYINELHHWRWTEKGGWERIDDIRSIEEFDL